MDPVKRKNSKKGTDEKIEIAVCPFCREPLALLPSVNSELFCLSADKALKLEDVVWVPETEIGAGVQVDCRGGMQAICKYCQGCLRFVGAPLCKYPCNGKCGENSAVRMVPKSHAPKETCGGPDISSGDFLGSFQNNPVEGDQLNDDGLAKSSD